MYHGKPIYKGPRGGYFYIDNHDNKQYVKECDFMN